MVFTITITILPDLGFFFQTLPHARETLIIADHKHQISLHSSTMPDTNITARVIESSTYIVTRPGSEPTSGENLNLKVLR